MKEKLKATTRRMIPVLAQIVQRYLPGYKIEGVPAMKQADRGRVSGFAGPGIIIQPQMVQVSWTRPVFIAAKDAKFTKR